MKTILANIDGAPDLYFENLDNDKLKELFMNEHWKWLFSTLKRELLDIVDKKQRAPLRSESLKLNIVNGQVYIEVIDPKDIFMKRSVAPANINTDIRITHIHILETLGQLEQNSTNDRMTARTSRRLRKHSRALSKWGCENI